MIASKLAIEYQIYAYHKILKKKTHSKWLSKSKQELLI